MTVGRSVSGEKEGSMSETTSVMHTERTVRVPNGWVMLLVNFAFLAVTIYGWVTLLLNMTRRGSDAEFWPLGVVYLLMFGLFVLSMCGFFTLQPNEARVLILFGAYKGTVRDSGFHWANPFYSRGFTTTVKAGQVRNVGPSRYKISLRARNFNSEKLKVNDKRGNPIEIGAVIVWRVYDTAQALFDVDDYENYVRVQSESAIRHLASAYAYDQGEENELTLRSSVDEVSQSLGKELDERLRKAGVVVDEARLTHLAYAPEIAQAMLRRQQAEAVIAARQKIVHGAVSMVDMALRELSERHTMELDEERKASMVSNLMVVLCGEAEVHPVINTGTLYT
jgi:regulator of protease activity HflC (stomatin/prohibitin superfamily)